MKKALNFEISKLLVFKVNAINKFRLIIAKDKLIKYAGSRTNLIQIHAVVNSAFHHPKPHQQGIKYRYQDVYDRR